MTELSLCTLHGASGFVLKDIPPNELLAAVRVVAKGEGLLAPSITQRAYHPVRGAPGTA
jgi:DNA-binding NarL/FixJ family response regulator